MNTISKAFIAVFLWSCFTLFQTKAAVNTFIVDNTAAEIGNSFQSIQKAYDSCTFPGDSYLIVVRSVSITEVNNGVMLTSKAASQITIYPNASLLFTRSVPNTNPFFTFNGARNVIIDGRVNLTGSSRNFTFVANNGPAFLFVNDASSNSIRYCTIRGNSSIINGLVKIDKANNNLISNNLFESNLTNYPFAIFNETPDNIDNNRILNNSFANFSQSAIRINNTNTVSKWVIKGNSFYRTSAIIPSITPIVTPHHIIQMNRCGKIEIDSNYFGGASLNGGTSATPYTVNLPDQTSFKWVYILNSQTGDTIYITRNRLVNQEVSISGAFSTTQLKLIDISGGAHLQVGDIQKGNFFGQETTNDTRRLNFNIKDNSEVTLVHANTTGNVSIIGNIYNGIEINDVTFKAIHCTAQSGSTKVTNNTFGFNSDALKQNNTTTKTNAYLLHESLNELIVEDNECKGTYNIGGDLIFFHAKGRNATFRNNTLETSSIPTTSQKFLWINSEANGIILIQSNQAKHVRLDNNSYYQFSRIRNAQTVRILENGIGTNSIQAGYVRYLDIKTASTSNTILIHKNVFQNTTSTNTTSPIDTDTLFVLTGLTTVDSNLVENTSLRERGIVYYSTNGGEFKFNQCINVNALNGNITGILINHSGTNPIKIFKNLLTDFTASTSATVTGINVTIQSGTPTIELHNNLIRLINGNYTLVGLDILSGTTTNTVSNLQVFYNTIIFTGNAVSSNPSVCLKVGRKIAATVKNNVFYNAIQNANGFNITETYASADENIVTNSNYLFSTQQNLAIWKAGSPINFTTWRTTSGADKSLSGTAVVFSIEGLPTSYFPGAGKAEVIPSITTDRQDNNRHPTAPWMGAVEGLQIEVPALTNPNLCSGSAISIPFNLAGNFPINTTFFAEISDNQGLFPASPNSIGSIVIASTPTPTTASISGTLPTNLISGNNYKIRVRSADSKSMDTISVSIIASPSLTTPTAIPLICTGNLLTIPLSSNGTSIQWSRDAIAGITPTNGSAIITGPFGNIQETLYSTNASVTTISYRIFSTNTVGATTCTSATQVLQVPIKNLVINPTSSSLPNGTVGQSYPTNVTFSVSPTPTPPTVVAIGLKPNNALPNGLSIENNTITGTPLSNGSNAPFTTTFTIQATEGNGCTVEKAYSITINSLLNPNLRFTPVVVAKSFEDEPFTIPINSRSNAPITYSLNGGGSTPPVLINPTTGRIQIQGVTGINFIWVVASQASTSIFAAAKDSVRLFISKAETTLQLTSGTSYALGLPKPLTYTFSSGYPVTTAPTEAIQSSNTNIAEVSSDADSIYPKTIGTFSVYFSFPETANYQAFDTLLQFSVFQQQIPPVAVTDTVRIIRNPDNSFTVDTINILANDTSKTALIQVKLTDIDANNVGTQYLYFVPSIGTFVYDTLNGNLIVTPFAAIQGTNAITYTLLDEEGNISAPAQIIIMVEDLAETPPLQANEVMTPNGDGQNDALVVGYTDVSQPNSILIYDIAGNTLYEKENYRNDWTGLDNKGNPLEAGVYYYVFKESSGTQRELTGYIKIRR